MKDADLILAETPAGAAARRQASMRSPEFFDTYYAGMRFAEHRSRWLTEIIGSYADAQYAHRASGTSGDSDDTRRKLLLLAPRDHGKSEVAMTTSALFICAQRGIRILFIGETQQKAAERLARVKAILESPRVVADWCSAPEVGWGPFIGKKPGSRGSLCEWDKSRIRVLRDHEDATPTVQTAGLGGALTGGHFDVIILDDPESRESVRSAAVRAFHKDWLRSTVLPMLNAGGVIVMIGTRKHHDDLYSMALSDPTWAVVTDVAIQRYPDSAQPVYGIDEEGRSVIKDWKLKGESSVLWPEERPIKRLLTQRVEMTETAFDREMQNKVVDDETALFKMPHLQAACDRGAGIMLYRGPWAALGLDNGGLLVVQAWDPAFAMNKAKAERNDTDFAVGVTLGICVVTGTRYIMGMSRSRGDSALVKARAVGREYRRFAPPDESASLLTRVQNGWCVGVAMEGNAAGEIQRMQAFAETGVPVIGRTTGPEVRDPFTGVPALSALFEGGHYVFPWGDAESRRLMSTLVTELHELGFAAHDDTVLALWIAERFARERLATYYQQRALAKRYADTGVPVPERLGVPDSMRQADLSARSRRAGQIVEVRPEEGGGRSMKSWP